MLNQWYWSHHRLRSNRWQQEALYEYSHDIFELYVSQSSRKCGISETGSWTEPRGPQWNRALIVVITHCGHPAWSQLVRMLTVLWGLWIKVTHYFLSQLDLERTAEHAAELGGQKINSMIQASVVIKDIHRALYLWTCNPILAYIRSKGTVWATAVRHRSNLSPVYNTAYQSTCSYL